MGGIKNDVAGSSETFNEIYRRCDNNFITTTTDAPSSANFTTEVSTSETTPLTSTETETTDIPLS